MLAALLSIMTNNNNNKFYLVKMNAKSVAEDVAVVVINAPSIHACIPQVYRELQNASGAFGLFTSMPTPNSNPALTWNK